MISKSKVIVMILAVTIIVVVWQFLMITEEM